MFRLLLIKSLEKEKPKYQICFLKYCKDAPS